MVFPIKRRQAAFVKRMADSCHAILALFLLESQERNQHAWHLPSLSEKKALADGQVLLSWAGEGIQGGRSVASEAAWLHGLNLPPITTCGCLSCEISQ